MTVRSWIAVWLAFHIVVSSAAAQQPAPATPAQPPALVESLKIRVLQGESAVNDLRTLQAVAPVIEVHDENDRPIEGADVVFQLPASGAGGFFPGQQLTRATKTNSQGQALGAGLIPNSQAGRFVIQVRAQLGGRFGRVEIHQTNSADRFMAREPKPKPRISRRWVWVSLIGAGAVVGVYFATRDGSGGASSSFALIPGPVVIVGPR